MLFFLPFIHHTNTVHALLFTFFLFYRHCVALFFSRTVHRASSFPWTGNSYSEKFVMTTTTTSTMLVTATKKYAWKTQPMHHLMYLTVWVRAIHHSMSNLKRNIIFDQANASFRFNKLECSFFMLFVLPIRIYIGLYSKILFSDFIYRCSHRTGDICS